MQCRDDQEKFELVVAFLRSHALLVDNRVEVVVLQKCFCSYDVVTARKHAPILDELGGLNVSCDVSCSSFEEGNIIPLELNRLCKVEHILHLVDEWSAAPADFRERERMVVSAELDGSTRRKNLSPCLQMELKCILSVTQLSAGSTYL